MQATTCGGLQPRGLMLVCCGVPAMCSKPSKQLKACQPQHHHLVVSAHSSRMNLTCIRVTCQRNGHHTCRHNTSPSYRAWQPQLSARHGMTKLMSMHSHVAACCMVHAIAALCNLRHFSKLYHCVPLTKRLSQPYMIVLCRTLWPHVTCLVLLLMAKPAGLACVAVCGYLRAACYPTFTAQQLKKRVRSLHKSIR